MMCMRRFILTSLLALLLAACSPVLSLGPNHADPLNEFTLDGEGRDKILVVHVRGEISDDPKEGWFGESGSPVQELDAKLRKAAKDERVKGLVVVVDSPGGGVTASDVMYKRIMKYKKDAGVPVAVSMMTVAASGGYYIACAADRIFAHESTLTGSVGVILFRPDVAGLMQKLGLKAEVYKSGKLKDVGSPFRDSTPEDRALLQTAVAEYADSFVKLVKTSRKLSDEQTAVIADARPLTAPQAMKLGLVDEIGLIDDAVEWVKTRQKLDKARTVVYRRSEIAEDGLYNTVDAKGFVRRPTLVETPQTLGLSRKARFYYLWLP